MDRRRSSPRDWQEFMRSSIWLDMRDELEIWLEQIRSQLEDQPAATADGAPPLDYGQLRYLQGGARQCRLTLTLPQMMMENCMEKQDDDN